MQTQNNSSQATSPSVALLIQDLVEAKKITQVFKELDILPYFFMDMESLWSSIIKDTPDFCLIDVKMMGNGKKFLVDHPFIKTEKIPVAFYYSAQTEPLLMSTHQIFNLGSVKKEGDYQLQLKSLLRRVGKLNRLENEVNELKHFDQKNKIQLRKWIEENEAAKFEKNLADELLHICHQFEVAKKEADFQHSIEAVLGDWDEIESYAYYEIDNSRRKLISPPSMSPKNENLPSVWHGSKDKEGLDSGSIHVASQVASEVFQGDLITLCLNANKRRTQKLIFLDVKSSEFYNNFNWDHLEGYLNGVLCHFESASYSVPVKSSQMLNSFEAMELGQKYASKDPSLSNSQLENAKRYFFLNFNLKNIVNYTLEETATCFSWTKFFEDFVNQFQSFKAYKLKIVSMDINNISFIVDENNHDEVFKDAKIHSSKFPVWRYFEDNDVILGKNFEISTKSTPLSARGYYKFIQTENKLENEEVEYISPLLKAAQITIPEEELNDRSPEPQYKTKAEKFWQPDL